MDDVEARIAGLEARLRRNHRLTVFLLSLVLLMIAAAALVVWRSIPRSVGDVTGSDVAGKSLQVWDPVLPRLTITATEAGWDLQVPTTKEGWTKAGAASLSYRLRDGSPTLTLTDADAKDVWHAP